MHAADSLMHVQTMPCRCLLLLLLEVRVSMMCISACTARIACQIAHSPFAFPREKRHLERGCGHYYFLPGIPACLSAITPSREIKLYWAPIQACLLPCVSSPVGVPPSVSSWACLDSALARPTVHGDCPDGLKGGKAFPSNEKRLSTD